jgi:hypothetical protein
VAHLSTRSVKFYLFIIRIINFFSSASPSFTPFPPANIIIDPNFEIRFYASIRIQIKGTTKLPCEQVKTVLFNCSQYVQRIKRELEDDQSGIPLQMVDRELSTWSNYCHQDHDEA